MGTEFSKWSRLRLEKATLSPGPSPSPGSSSRDPQSSRKECGEGRVARTGANRVTVLVSHARRPLRPPEVRKPLPRCQ